MTELLDLMSETNRSSGSSASQPQHPSDLTRRYTASAVSKAWLASFWLSNRLIWCLLVGTTKDAWHTRSHQWLCGSGSSTTARQGSALPMSQITFEVILVISDCQIMLLLCNLPKHCFFPCVLLLLFEYCCFFQCARQLNNVLVFSLHTEALLEVLNTLQTFRRITQMMSSNSVAVNQRWLFLNNTCRKVKSVFSTFHLISVSLAETTICWVWIEVLFFGNIKALL